MNKLLITLLFLFVGCERNQENCNDILTYEKDVQSIIEISCNNGDCHVGLNGGWIVLPDFSTYNNLLPYIENGKFNYRINSTDTILSMPPLFREDRQISNDDLALLNEWINLEFPRNCTN